MSTATPLLLCRPVNGLNDILSQIDNACRYAEQTGRTVIVETDSSSTVHFKDAFSKYFISKQPLLRLDAAEFKHLFDTLDVYPKCLFGRVNSYAAKRMPEKGGYVDVETSTRLSFDFSRLYDEPLLVHHSGGSNGNALSALGRMRLHDDIVDTLVDRLRAIGSPYSAIHIRHTDYQTSYENELIKLQPSMPGAIFLATDNRVVVDFCRSIFGNDRVYSFARLPDRAGKPLHILDTGDPAYEINTDAIVDLLLLALAKRFYYFSIQDNLEGMRHSGFTVLVNRLRSFPFVLHHLIGRYDEALEAVLPAYR
jgi:hypothetical protein